MADAEIRADIRLDRSKLAGDVSKAEKELDRLLEIQRKNTDAISKQENAVKALRQQLEAIKVGEKLPASLTAMESALKKAQKEFAESDKNLQNIVNGLEEAQKIIKDAPYWSVVDPAKLSKAKEDIGRLTKAFDVVAEKVGTAEDKVHDLATKLSDIKLRPETSREATKLADDLALSEKKLADLKSTADKTRYSIDTARTSISDMRDELSDAAETGGDYFERTEKSISSASSGMREMTSGTANSGRAFAAMGGVSTRVMGKLAQYTGNVTRALVQVGRYAVTGFGNLLMIIPRAIVGMMRLTRQFRLFNREGRTAGRHMDVFGRRIYGLLKNVFVFGVIAAAIRGMRDNMTALLGTNEQLSQSWNNVKVNLLTAFAPIWEAIQPALTTLTYLLERATFAMASFVAMLGGKTYESARDAAKALYDQVKATNALGKASKNAAKNLQSFEQVNQIVKDTADEGADIGDSLDFDFPAPDISWIEDLRKALEGLTDPYERAFETGKVLAEQFTNWMDSIDWDKIQDGAREAAGRVASFLNGFFSDPEMWKALGRTLAQGLNTALYALEEFIDIFDWSALGKGLAAGLNEFIDTFDWEAAGRVPGKLVNGIFTTLHDFIEDTRWYDLGQGFATSVNTFFRTVDWELVGDTVGDGITAFFTTVRGFIDNYESGLIGQSLTTLFTAAMNAIQWNFIGETLMLAFNEFMNDVYVFLTTFDFKKLGKNFADLLNGAIDSIDSDLLGGTMAAIINAVIDFVAGIADNLKWGELGTKLGTSLDKMLKDIKWKQMGETFSDLINGVLLEAYNFIASVDWKRAGSDLGTFFVELLGGIDWDLFKNTISSALSGIWDFFVGFIETLKNDGDIAAGKIVAITAAVAGLVAIFTTGNVFVGIAAAAIAGLMSLFAYIEADYIPNVERFGDDISRTTKNMLNPIIDLADDVRLKLTQMFIESKPIVMSDTAEIASYFKNMADTAIIELERMRNAAIENLAAIFGEEAQNYEKRLAESNRYYDNIISDIEREGKALENALREATRIYGEESEEAQKAAEQFTKYQDSRIEKIEDVEAARGLDLLRLRDEFEEELEIYFQHVDGINTTYDTRLDNLKTAHAGILEEMQIYLNEGGTLESDYYKEMLIRSEAYLSDIKDAIVLNDAERISLANTRNTDLLAIDSIHTDEVIKNTDRELDETYRLAQEKYDKVIAQAEALKRDGTEISKELADAMIAEAEREFREITYLSELNHAESVKRYNMMGDEILTETEKMNRSFRQKWDDFWSWLPWKTKQGAADVVKEFSGSMEDSINSMGGSGLLSPADDSVDKLMAEMKRSVESGDYSPYKELGENTASGVTSGIRNGTGEVLDAISDVTNGIINAYDKGLDQHSPSRVMEEKAESTISGVMRGFGNMLSDLKQSTIKFIDIIIDNFVDTFKISGNMSGLTREFGEVLIIGLNTGIENKQPVLIDTVQTLTEGMKTAFETLSDITTITLEEMFNRMTNSLDVFRSSFLNILSGVVQQANSMLNQLSSIMSQMSSMSSSMSNISISVPRFASGAAVYGDTLAIVGDNRGASYDPEIVAPLSSIGYTISDAVLRRLDSFRMPDSFTAVLAEKGAGQGSEVKLSDSTIARLANAIIQGVAEIATSLQNDEQNGSSYERISDDAQIARILLPYLRDEVKRTGLGF
jgi:hypothetical protein